MSVVVPISPNLDVANRVAMSRYSAASGQDPGNMPPGSAMAGFIPDSNFALMAAATMNSEGKFPNKDRPLAPPTNRS